MTMLPLLCRYLVVVLLLVVVGGPVVEGGGGVHAPCDVACVCMYVRMYVCQFAPSMYR
jgi:hypothetical protein